MKKLKKTSLCNCFIYFAIISLVIELSFYYSFIYMIFLGPILFLLRKRDYFILLIGFIAIVLGSTIVSNIRTKNTIDPKMTSFTGSVSNVNDYKITVRINKSYLLLYYYGEKKIKPGDKISFSGVQEEAATSYNYYRFDYRKHLKNKNIQKIVKAKDIDVIKHGFSFNLLSYYVGKYFELIGNSKTTPYLKSLLIGDKEDLLITDNLQRVGISHLFAISGLHIGLLAMIIKKLLLRVNLDDNKIDIVLIVFFSFYMILTGFSPSVLRASLMIILSIINKRRNWGLSTLDIISIVFSFLLIMNPLYILNNGFILSFVVTFGIILSKDILTGSAIKQGLKLSIISFFITLPIVINMTNQVNILSIFINVFIIPFFSIIFLPMTFLTVIFPFLNFIYGYMIISFEFLVSLLDKSSIMIQFRNFSSPLVIIYYVLFFIAVKNYEVRTNLRKALYLFIFLFVVFNSSYFSLYNKIMIFDVGQGDTSLISLKNNQGNILVDCFSDSPKYLASLGIRTLDYLIITHGHKDHMGSYKELFERMIVKKVIISAFDQSENILSVIALAKKKEIEVIRIKDGTILTFKNLRLEFLGPISDNDNLNNISLVFRLVINKNIFLFTGDMELEEFRELYKKYGNKLNCDYLKLGHHGSKTATDEFVIEVTSPKKVIISVGLNNSFGLPDDEVLNILEKNKIDIHETQKKGSFVYEYN